MSKHANRLAAKSRKSQRVEIHLLELLFSAIAINLMCIPIFIGAILVVSGVYFYYNWLGGPTLNPPQETLSGDELSILLVIELIIWPVAFRLCWWAAKGFVNERYFPISVATVGFIGYAFLTIKYEITDGYICAATIVFVLVVFLWTKLLRLRNGSI